MKITPGTAGKTGPSVMLAWIRQLRCEQWIKNGFVLAPVVFGLRLTNTQSLIPTALAFVAFCLAASASYCLNDLMDLEEDSRHPEKRRRPLASGTLSRVPVATAMGALFAFSIASAWVAGTGVLVALAYYIVLNILYSCGLRRIAILDVLVLASGYVVRVLAGAAAASVVASPWVLVVTFFIALVLGFGKRRSEMTMNHAASDSRSVLAWYDLPMLDMLITISVASTIISYALYVVESETALRVGAPSLLLTLPCVVFGLFRYVLLLRTSHTAGNPTRMVLTDVPLGISIVVWGLIVVVLLYLPRP